ncbi:MAG: hypothetical protein IKL96_05750 [Kiritimatiellae bacterium]|nr:hypothetical protein [Kiritimatiellia bacterium]
MNEEIKGDNTGMPGEMSSATAVRIYERADASTEFPVLKAFQEYLEAEQAKAHKRMLSLSIFFIVLLVIVVLTFSVIALFMINRNQTLSDRLMDIALRERITPAVQPAPAPVVNVQQPAQPPVDDGARMKPILEKLEAMQAEIARARAAAAAAETHAKAQPAAPATPREDPQSAKLRADAAREASELAKQQAAVKAAREKLKVEQELLRKEQIEQQRRRLYPEYYAQEDARKAAEEAAKNPPPPPAEPVKPSVKPPVEPIRPPAPAEVAVKPKPPVKPTAPKKSALQLLLDEDDVPSATSPAKRLSDEDADKVDAELRRSLGAAPAPSKPAAPVAPQKKPVPPVPQPPKPPAAAAKQPPATPPPAHPAPSPKPESIDVGAKEDDMIPWLLGDMDASAAPAPVEKKPEQKKTEEKKPEPKKPEGKDLKQNTNNNK